MTYEQAMRDLAEMLPLMEADERLAAIRARLALAERVVEAARAVHGWGCPSLQDGEDHDWEVLGAALAAWKEGEP